jgi:hypothetical protein
VRCARVIELKIILNYGRSVWLVDPMDGMIDVLVAGGTAGEPADKIAGLTSGSRFSLFRIT